MSAGVVAAATAGGAASTAGGAASTAGLEYLNPATLGKATKGKATKSEGGGGGSMLPIFGQVIETADKGLDFYTKLSDMITGRREKLEKQEQKNLDQTFTENQRRFGLDFALRDYATRQGITLQKAQMLFNADQQRNQNAITSENVKTSALGRNMQQKQFDWAKQDRAKNIAFKKAMQKGLVSGLLGG